MNVIGLLMLSHEDDILGSVLQYNAPLVDAFYVLDGTTPNIKSRALCEHHVGCLGYWHDSELPEERYGSQPRDGWRQHLLEAAVADWGHDNLFCLLHGDEVWTVEPRRVAEENPGFDGFIFPLPVYFPREPWQDDVHPLEQLTWHLSPGWPEVRMFRGGASVRFADRQHFNVTPAGVGRATPVPYPIRHYPYRSPAHQLERARRHQETGFDPANYEHVLRGEVIWSDEMIARLQSRSEFRELAQGAA